MGSLVWFCFHKPRDVLRLYSINESISLCYLYCFRGVIDLGLAFGFSPTLHPVCVSSAAPTVMVGNPPAQHPSAATSSAAARASTITTDLDAAALQ
jgi:hypothetical protein